MLVLAVEGNQETLLLKGKGVTRSGLFSDALLLSYWKHIQPCISKHRTNLGDIHTHNCQICLPSAPENVLLVFHVKAKQAPHISTCSWRTPHGTQPKFESGPDMKPFASEGNSYFF